MTNSYDSVGYLFTRNDNTGERAGRTIRGADPASVRLGSDSAVRFDRFTLNSRHSHDNSVLALRPMLSTLDRFRFPGQNWRMVAAQRKGTRSHVRCAARPWCIGWRTRGIRHDRCSSACPRTRGRTSAAAKEPFQIPVALPLAMPSSWRTRRDSSRIRRTPFRSTFFLMVSRFRMLVSSWGTWRSGRALPQMIVPNQVGIGTIPPPSSGVHL
jgi:hypothetical protein